MNSLSSIFYRFESLFIKISSYSDLLTLKSKLKNEILEQDISIKDEFDSMHWLLEWAQEDYDAGDITLNDLKLRIWGIRSILRTFLNSSPNWLFRDEIINSYFLEYRCLVIELLDLVDWTPNNNSFEDKELYEHIDTLKKDLSYWLKEISDKQKIIIYPNPCKDKLTISVPEKNNYFIDYSGDGEVNDLTHKFAFSPSTDIQVKVEDILLNLPDQDMQWASELVEWLNLSQQLKEYLSFIARWWDYSLDNTFTWWVYWIDWRRIDCDFKITIKESLDIYEFDTQNLSLWVYFIPKFKALFVKI